MYLTPIVKIEERRMDDFNVIFFFANLQKYIQKMFV